jgi:hypothetical protein
LAETEAGSLTQLCKAVLPFMTSVIGEYHDQKRLLQTLILSPDKRRSRKISMVFTGFFDLPERQIDSLSHVRFRLWNIMLPILLHGPGHDDRGKNKGNQGTFYFLYK